MDWLKEFKEYKSKIGDRISIYSLVAKKYNIKRALYPGSHIDISPSMVIPEVTYVDNFKGAIKFFEDIRDIEKYVNRNKEYQEMCNIIFIGTDYNNELNINKVDIIISQYAGFVGQATKRYLKEDGILLCNDSHGDATLAYLDEDYILVGVFDQHNNISTKQLEKYFVFKNGRQIDENKVRSTMKGPKYEIQATNYIFKLKTQPD
jgi:hypothetical protein